MMRLSRVFLLTIAIAGLPAACSKQKATEAVAPATVDQPALVAVPATVPPAPNVPTLLEQAETLRRQAAESGHEWSNHGPTIAAAREALDAGDAAEAGRLASLAVLIGEQSLLQAETEAERWRDAVPE